MKLQPAIYLLIVLLLINIPPGLSQKFYLSPSGDDDNPGTIEKPLASPGAAVILAREWRKDNPQDQPVEIIALSGEYYLFSPLLLTEEDSGTPASPLIFTSESGGRSIFRGAVRISGFERVNETMWRAFIPQVAYYDAYFEQLYVNDRRAVRARSPNEGFFNIIKVEETVVEEGTGRSPEVAVQKIFINASDGAGIDKLTDKDREDALIVFYHKWDNTRKRILHYNSNESAVFIAGGGMKPWNQIDARSRWLAENYFAALDSPGEWYLDRSGYLYYIPLPGETPENTVFHAPIIKEFVKISGKSETSKVSNIQFENISFSVAGYRTPPSGNDPAQAAAPEGAVITLDFADNITFTGCEIAHTGNYGLWFRRGCSNCKAAKCYIHDLGAGGIKLGETEQWTDQSWLTNNITVDNNIITDGGHIFPCAVGIVIFHASDNKLTHNDISNFRYTGVSVGWVWGYDPSPSKRNLIAYNHIHHLGWGELCDMGGVYTLGASEGTVVANNLIHHIYSFDYGGWGLYTDEGSFGIVMENNLVYACKSSGFHQHYGRENVIRNNIFAFNIRSQLQATRVEEHRSLSFTNNIIYFDRGTLLSSNWDKFNLLTDNNCYWDTRSKDIMFAEYTFSDWNKLGKDTHSLIADPGFADPASYDFHFRKRSVVRKIRFVPFDYSLAGVYGTEEWKKLAKSDADLINKFNNIVNQFESSIKSE